MRTTEQERAYFALKCVERIKELVGSNIWTEFEDDDFKKEVLFSPENIGLNELKEYLKRGGIGEILESIIDKEMEKILGKEKKHKSEREKILREWKKFKDSESPSPEILQKLEPFYQGISISFKETNLKKDYASHAKKLPQLIVANGLPSTIAFYKSKGKERGQIHLDLELWLKYKNFIQQNDLLNGLLNIDGAQLRVITAEALSFSEWLKRMAEVELREE